MTIMAYTKSGTKSSTPVKLDKNIFGVEVNNHQLLKDAYLANQAKARQAGAKTKNRGEVRGSTAKPWRQKGTGNARFGSKYNPIWRGGGVAFGPTGNQNFVRKLNVKAKSHALKQALSLAASQDRIKIIDTFENKEGKVKTTTALLKKIGADKTSVVVVDLKDQMTDRATRNLPGVKAVQASYLSVNDVLDSDNLIISKKSLELLAQRLGGKHE